VRQLVSNSGDRKQQVEKAKQRRQLNESSAPEEEEPNDFPKQATLFKLGGDLRPIEAAIGDGDDTDWFALTSRNSEAWQVQITVTPASDELDPIIRVAVDGSQEAPIEYNVAGPGEVETVPILSVSSAPQLIAISGKDGSTGKYEISFQKRLSGGAIEAEPNDDIEAATRFEAPGEIQGFYDRPGDRDVYFIPRKGLNGDIFHFEVSPVDDVVQQVSIYTHRSMESAYVSLQVPPARAAGIPNLALPDDVLGVWVVLTAGESYSRDKSYRIKLLGHPPAEHALEAEPNDAPEIAQEIELGTRLAGYFHVPEDVDHFRLYVDGIPDESEQGDSEQGESEQDKGQSGGEADAGRPSDPTQAAGAGAADAGSDDQAPDAGLALAPPDPLEALAEKTPPEHVVSVTASPRHENARLALAWTNNADAQGQSLIESSKPGDAVTLCNRVVDSGFLDLEVRPVERPEDTLPGGYDYGLVAEEVGGQPGLEIEPNDTRDQADKLTRKGQRTGYIARPGDTDVYAFAVPFPTPEPVDPSADAANDAKPAAPPEPKTVRLVLEASPLNLGFELLDDEGGFVAEVNRAGAGAQEKLQIDLPPGLYFVHVSAKHGFACEPYSINVRVDE
jgi:hypothetical protein